MKALPMAYAEQIRTSLMRLKAVQAQTGLTRSTLYKLMKNSEFPRPVKLTGSRAVAWNSQVIEAWVTSRITAD